MKTAAELAAECMRICDLLSAGDGPMTPDDWDQISKAADRVRHVAAANKREARKARKIPMPIVSSGMGLCSELCDHFDRTESLCTILHSATAPMVPCRPWVETELAGWKSALAAGGDMIAHLKQKLQEKQDGTVNTHGAMQCEYLTGMYVGCSEPSRCGEWTYGRKDEKPCCARHGGR